MIFYLDSKKYLRRRLCFWLFYIINVYGYSLYIPYVFHIYFLNMFHIFSFVFFLIYGVTRRQVLIAERRFLTRRNADDHIRVSASIVVLDRVPLRICLFCYLCWQRIFLCALLAPLVGCAVLCCGALGECGQGPRSTRTRGRGHPHSLWAHMGSILL